MEGVRETLAVITPYHDLPSPLLMLALSNDREEGNDTSLLILIMR